jgi:hypothetical protein
MRKMAMWNSYGQSHRRRNHVRRRPIRAAAWMGLINSIELAISIRNG